MASARAISRPGCFALRHAPAPPWSSVVAAQFALQLFVTVAVPFVQAVTEHVPLCVQVPDPVEALAIPLYVHALGLVPFVPEHARPQWFVTDEAAPSVQVPEHVPDCAQTPEANAAPWVPAPNVHNVLPEPFVKPAEQLLAALQVFVTGEAAPSVHVPEHAP